MIVGSRSKMTYQFQETRVSKNLSGLRPEKPHEVLKKSPEFSGAEDDLLGYIRSCFI